MGTLAILMFVGWRYCFYGWIFFSLFTFFIRDINFGAKPPVSNRFTEKKKSLNIKCCAISKPWSKINAGSSSSSSRREEEKTPTFFLFSFQFVFNFLVVVILKSFHMIGWVSVLRFWFCVFAPATRNITPDELFGMEEPLECFRQYLSRRMGRINLAKFCVSKQNSNSLIKPTNIG